MKMKTLTIFIALTFSVLFSSSSYAGRTKMDENTIGDVFHLNFETYVDIKPVL